MQPVVARTAAVAILATLLLCLVALAGSEPLRDTPPEPSAAPPPAASQPPPVPQELPPPPAAPPEADPIEPEEDPASFGWLRWVLALLAVLAVVWATAQLLRWRRGRAAPPRRRPEPEPPAPPSSQAEAEAVVARQAVDAALAPLRDPADPRAAVIEAYARMEQVLAQRQLARRAPETPREYLDRVLRAQGVPQQPLTVLTTLFEEARYSLHPIAESAQARAVSELETARVALG